MDQEAQASLLYHSRLFENVLSQVKTVTKRALLHEGEWHGSFHLWVAESLLRLLNCACRVDALQLTLVPLCDIPAADQILIQSGKPLDAKKTLGAYGLPVCYTASSLCLSVALHCQSFWCNVWKSTGPWTVPSCKFCAHEGGAGVQSTAERGVFGEIELTQT